MAGKRIDDITRQQIKEAHASGLSMRQIAREFGIGSSSVDRIVKEEGPQNAETEKMSKTERQLKIEALERRIDELEKKVLGLKAKKKC
ncbi:MAG: helix-turn-helix domain-containing protein [Proteobacteria bacterium]|nr:helix-turn-helix domain-containing protein [Pseudomonadota bacterium]